MVNERRWEHFPHDADIGVRGIGASREEAFEQAAVAVTAVITDPHTVAANEVVEVGCEARAAMERFNGYDLQGRALTVNEAKPQEQRSGNGRSAFGRGRSSSGGGGRGWGRASGGRERRW